MVCEMLQEEKLQGSPNPTTQVSIGKPSKGAPYRMTVLVPPSVWLQGGVRLVADDKDVTPTASFKWCIQSRCLADVDLPDDAMKKLRSLSNTGKLIFREASQRDVSMPVSFKGFDQALTVMEKQ
jgi:invasion protein IalB